MPIEALPAAGEGFLAAVSGAWEKNGLSVEAEDEEEVMIRRVSSGSYRARALINLPDQMAYLEGSGPCVDNPRT
jgi:hypothetical protein